MARAVSLGFVGGCSTERCSGRWVLADVVDSGLRGSGFVDGFSSERWADLDVAVDVVFREGLFGMDAARRPVVAPASGCVRDIHPAAG